MVVLSLPNLESFVAKPWVACRYRTACIDIRRLLYRRAVRAKENVHVDGWLLCLPSDSFSWYCSHYYRREWRSVVGLTGVE